MTAGLADDNADLAARQLSRLLRRHVPELVTSLDLIGSAVDGDFRPGRSDLDFVAVLSHPATDDEIEALVIVHRLYASDPTLPALDGIWVTAEELAAGPDACSRGPTSQGNQFLASARGDRNPITWERLRLSAVAIMGELDRSRLWRDPERLASWTRQNVESWWVPWYARACRLLSAPGLRMLGARLPACRVLGISRLHLVLAKGVIASKSAAGEYALTAFGQTRQRIVRECLRIRRGESAGLYGNPFERRRDALDFIAMVIADIRARQRASE